MTRARALGVVVLHFGNVRDTQACLRSLLAADPRPARIVVVDNGGDGIDRLLAAAAPPPSPRIELLSPGANLGYAGGMNLGIRTLMSDEEVRVIVLLNNDTVAAPDVFRGLGEALREGSGVHLATPRILYDDSDRTWSAGERVCYPLLWARSYSAAPPARRINGVTGCAMAVRREVFERIGLFDENYFAYVEDVDFCLRANAAGFRFTCCPESVVYHNASSSLGDFSPAKVYLNVRNKAYFIRKNIHPIWWPLSWPWYLLTVLSWAFRALRKGKPDVVRSILVAGRDAIRGRMGPPPRWK